MEEKKYKQKYTKYKLINNLINSLDGIIVIGTTSASFTLSITGVDIIVVPITAGVGCATGILVKICSSYLKLFDFRQLYITSLKANHIDKKEFQRFVTQFENYRVASREASHTKSHTHTTSRVASHAATHTTNNTT